MSLITERYASSINSSNLKSRPETTYSDTDTLGAFGIAAKYVPLGVALQRLFVDGKAHDAIETMATMVQNKSHRIKDRLSYSQAIDLSKKVLAWYRYGTCTECGGTGKEVIFEPKPHLSDEDCPTCRGTGKRPFEPSFTHDTRDLALWLKGEVEREQAWAGREAMRVIGATFNLD